MDTSLQERKAFFGGALLILLLGLCAPVFSQSAQVEGNTNQIFSDEKAGATNQISEQAVQQKPEIEQLRDEVKRCAASLNACGR